MAASGCAARGGPAHRRAAPCAERPLGAQRRAPSAPSARSAVRRARNARRRSGSPQAPGAQSAHATGAERVARGGASCELACCLLAQPAHGHAVVAGWEAFAC